MNKSEFQSFISEDTILNYFKRDGADIGYNVPELCQHFKLKRDMIRRKLENLVALKKLKRTECKNGIVGYYLPEKEGEINK